MRKVYVAHPYGGKEENKILVEKIILGLVPTNNNTLFISPIHALGFLYEALPYDEGMEYCFELLKGCKELILCEGWEYSEGCRREYKYALDNNIRIRYYKKGMSIDATPFTAVVRNNEYTICPRPDISWCPDCNHYKKGMCDI